MENLGRIPPQDTAAEMCVLGAMILEPPCIGEAVELVCKEDFYAPANQTVFAAIVGLSGTGKPVDLVTLKAALEDAGSMDSVGGTDYLGALVDGTPNASNMPYYAQIVSDRAAQRRIIRICANCMHEAYRPQECVSDLVSAFESQAMAVRRNGGRGLIHLGAAGESEIAHMAKVRDGTEGPGIGTGYEHLDRATRNLRPGELIVLAGDTGVGKSALAHCIAWHNAMKNSKTVLICSTEMLASQVAKRILQIDTQESGWKLRYPQRLTSVEWDTVQGAVQKLHAVAAYILEGSASPSHIATQCRRIKQQCGSLDLVVVDYLQDLDADPDAGKTRTERVSATARAMKRHAVELRVPVLLLASLNRESHKEQRPPRKWDLRQSGDIEYASDQVWLLHRDPAAASSEHRTIWFKLDKHRDGAETPWDGKGAIRLKFAPRTTTFLEDWTIGECNAQGTPDNHETSAG